MEYHIQGQECQTTNFTKYVRDAGPEMLYLPNVETQCLVAVKEVECFTAINWLKFEFEIIP